MKLYEMAKAPNPRRVRMFLAEKGLLDKVDCIEIDLSKGENLTPEFERKNPIHKQHAVCYRNINVFCGEKKSHSKTPKIIIIR